MQYLEIVQSEDEAAAAEQLDLQQTQAVNRTHNGSNAKQDSTPSGKPQKTLRMGFRSMPCAGFVQGCPLTDNLPFQGQLQQHIYVDILMEWFHPRVKRITSICTRLSCMMQGEAGV